jgi:hypothetical protein
MKLLLVSLTFMSICSQTFATDYKCINDSLESTNSSIFYNLSNDEVDKLIDQGNFYAVKAAKDCDFKEKQYQCIANSLEAYNSSRYYNLSHSEIETMLYVTEASGHTEALDAASKCGNK